MGVRLAIAAAVLSLSSFPAVSAQTDPPTVLFLSHDQARPVFEALGESLPPAGEWARWIATSDRTARARLVEGDETSVVNLLLFGTSFTKEPRVTMQQVDAQQLIRVLEQRLADFERAVARPGPNERLQFARKVLGDDQPVRVRLLSMLDRAIQERDTHERLIREAHALGDPSLEFAERSTMYRARGLSSDTSVRTSFAIDEALRELVAAGRLTSVSRVAVIGPGLDFADKQEGYDFYPVQTIQPVALADSLIRVRAAQARSLRVTTFDLSARVNEHIHLAERRAREGSPYVVHLAVDGQTPWTGRFLDYWKAFGSEIGSVIPTTLPPGIGAVQLRAIEVRPEIVQNIRAHDLNITAQRLALSDSERFDLIVGTNIFIYYDRLQQALAMASVAGMLRPGGLLLSNNALVEVPSFGIRSIGYSRISYSKRDEDGELVIWYQKAGE